MLAALLRYSKTKRRIVSQEWARRSQRTQATKRIECGPDAETVRHRVLYDARGAVLREGITYKGNGSVIPWRVRRAITGRVNQVEIVVGGRVWRITSLRDSKRLLN